MLYGYACRSHLTDNNSGSGPIRDMSVEDAATGPRCVGADFPHRHASKGYLVHLTYNVLLECFTEQAGLMLRFFQHRLRSSSNRRTWTLTSCVFFFWSIEFEPIAWRSRIENTDRRVWCCAGEAELLLYCTDQGGQQETRSDTRVNNHLDQLTGRESTSICRLVARQIVVREHNKDLPNIKRCCT